MQAGGSGPSTLSVLFTDVVGSTDMRRVLGDDHADTLRREHDELVRAAIGAHQGSEVKNTGDGLMVVFPAAAAAIAGSVDVQRAVVRFNRRAEHPIGVRVGLSAGDVVWEGDDCFGTPVVEARRLCDAADEGQILASDVVRVLAGTRGDHRLESMGLIELKGLGEVAAWAVRWEPQDAETAELPRALLGDASVPLVGRSAELDQLAAAWKEAAQGRAGLVLVSGEPGVGKTRLSAELAHRVHEQGATVLFGCCDEELGVPYQPFLEAIRSYVAACPAERLGEQAEPVAGDLARLVPELSGRLGIAVDPVRADPETERFRLFDAVGSFLAAIATASPLLLVLDDIHWATKPTLLLLRHIVRASPESACLLVATYRDTDLDRGHPLAEVLADLRREPAVQRLALHGLDEAGVADFLRSAAGHDLDAEGERLAVAVHAETDGNPFFVGQVLQHFIESGSIVQHDGRWVRGTERIGIPEGVREVVGRRLSRLAEPTNELLGVASVLGREFDIRLVVDTAGVDIEDVLDAFEEAEGRQLVWPDAYSHGRWTFTHALVRQTLYEEIPTTRRLRLHRAAARALERRVEQGDTRLDELAYHYCEAAALGETDKALEWCRAAAAEALERTAYEEAAGYYERALGVLDPELDAHRVIGCELRVAQARALRMTADRATCRSLALLAVEGARRVGRPDLLADAALVVGRDRGWSEAGVVDEELIALLEESLDALPAGESPLRARVGARLGAELYFLVAHSDRRRALTEEALAMARRLDDPVTLGYVLDCALWGAWVPGNPAERLVMAQELIAVAARAGDRQLEYYAHNWLVNICAELGDRSGFDAAIDAEQAVTEELRHAEGMWASRVHAACRALVDADCDEASRLAEDALALGQAMGSLTAFQMYGVNQFALCRMRGGLENLVPAVRAMVEQYPLIPAWRCALAYLYRELGLAGEAREQLEVLAVDGFRGIPEDANWKVGMALLATVAAMLRDAPRAGRIYEMLLPYADSLMTGGMPADVLGSMHTPLALLAMALDRWEDAEGHFEAALEANRRFGTVPWLNVVRYEYAAALASRGRVVDADRTRALATDCRADAEAHGMTRIQGMADALLAELR